MSVFADPHLHAELLAVLFFAGVLWGCWAAVRYQLARRIVRWRHRRR